MAGFLFEQPTPLHITVRASQAYWDFISTVKHPVMAGRLEEVLEVLADPDVVRRSRKDAAVLLFYRQSGWYHLCAVVRREDGTGFLVTAYPTQAIKAGEELWRR